MWLRRLLIGVAIWQGARMAMDWLGGNQGQQGGPADPRGRVNRRTQARVAQRRTLMRGIARAKADSRVMFRRQLARAKAQARVAQQRAFMRGRGNDGMLQRIGSLLAGLVR